jgi:hypothetical protein
VFSYVHKCIWARCASYGGSDPLVVFSETFMTTLTPTRTGLHDTVFKTVSCSGTLDHLCQPLVRMIRSGLTPRG